MTYETLSIERDGSVVRVTLDRSEVRNAFDDRMVAELTEVFGAAAGEGDVRAVVLTGSGDAFSAGADLSWMRRMASTYPKLIWLNPTPRNYWNHTHSIDMVRELIGDRMFPLTLNGLDQGMRCLST